MKDEVKLNCWEYKKCGKDKTGECPAYPTGGHICYLIENTVCNKGQQGSYLSKIKDCRKCEFYAALKKSE